MNEIKILKIMEAVTLEGQKVEREIKGLLYLITSVIGQSDSKLYMYLIKTKRKDKETFRN